MASIITDTLVCGNCIQLIEVNNDKQRLLFCAMHNCFVRKSDVFCTSFRWTGITESPKQLLRFSKGERLNAAMSQ